MIYTKICRNCGCKYQATGRASLYCSPCAYEAKREWKQRDNKRRRMKKLNIVKPNRLYSISELENMARNEGMHYGMYVAKYGL